MKRQRTNRIRRSFRPQLADLEARHLLSHSGLSPRAEAHAMALVKSQAAAASSGGTDVIIFASSAFHSCAHNSQTGKIHFGVQPPYKYIYKKNASRVNLQAV